MSDFEILEGTKNENEGYYRTTPYLTRFELAKAISVRALILSNGETPKVEVSENFFDPIEIATLEIKKKLVPLIVRRKFFNGEFEDWDIREMIIKRN